MDVKPMMFNAVQAANMQAAAAQQAAQGRLPAGYPMHMMPQGMMQPPGMTSAEQYVLHVYTGPPA